MSSAHPLLIIMPVPVIWHLDKLDPFQNLWFRGAISLILESESIGIGA